MPVLAQSRPFPDWEWIQRNGDVIVERGIEHVQLTIMAVAIGFLIAFPLAVMASRHPRLQGPVLQVTGVLFTIPSLALFVALVPLTGLSTASALIPLTIYTLLILVRNTIAGLDSVPVEVVEAARAMGYRETALLRSVQLPLALPVIIAGVRIATVTTIGLVVITALIGQGGWGQIILQGFQRQNLTPTLVGFILSVTLAVVLDIALVALERRLSPWSKAARG
ncbi:ABC transporter permease [Euzebya sp.]|uniref:ABC transporter permease n=1 Tax=Euzebya sp. TaxID=1971409 RepID=UPI003513DA08